MPHANRRKHARLSLDRPVKLQCLTTGRYLTGRTRNVSGGGLLIEVDHASLLVAGQRLKVAVAWDRRQMVVERERMPQATVVRCLGHVRVQHVAVQFDRPVAHALAAAG
jgi:hypothetical protein